MRLALGFAVAFASMALLVAGVQTMLADRFGHLATRMSMEGQTEDIFDGFVLDAERRVVDVNLPPGERVGFDDFFANLKFRVLDGTGQVVASSEPDRRSLLPDRGFGEQPGFFGVVTFDGRDFFVGAWQREIQGRPYVLQLARSDRFELLAREAVTPAITDTVVLLGALSALIFALAGALAVRSVLRPIRAAEAAARSVGGRNLAARLPEDGMPAEIRPLVHAFNGVLQRLEQSFQEQERFIANAAHELKTPLALARARVEAGLDDERDRARLLQDLDTMGRQVQQLLQLAQVADPQAMRLGLVRPLDVARAVLDHLAFKAQRADITLHLQEPEVDVQVEADAGALFVLLKNLVENALDFSPPGSDVRVRLDDAGVAVEDHGPGVPPEYRAQVFERFWRAPGQTRTGSGLGLALVREIVVAHGWSVECGAAPGGGASFRVRWRS
ncbi:MAG: sensor histidine kinase [Pseudomonadota bacterium]|nr:HAMP domain-containing protein [Rubrivivax sp.]MCA3258480.1 HAMP domain-containing protein [Rubrivivax sp.]MCZ8031570.1 ATP-binding protein [Rubrivivax sp.]